MIVKNLRLFLPGLFLLVALFFVARSGSDTCGAAYRIDKAIQIGNHELKAEIVSIPSQLEKGLGGRACINSDQGMLFVFGSSGYYSMWMKDMRFPIDIIWLSPEKKVVYTKLNVWPATYPQTFTNGQPAEYVLELKAGQAKKLDVVPGTNLDF